MEKPPLMPLPLLLEDSAALAVETVFAIVLESVPASDAPAPCA